MAVVGESGRIEFSINRTLRSRFAASLALIIAATAVTVFLVHEHSRSSAPTAASAAAVPGAVVNIGPNACGQGWTGGHAGRQTFALWNTFDNGVEAYLVNDATRNIVLDAERVGLGTKRSFSVALAAGSYHFVCLNAETTAPASGPTVQVTGSYAGPVTQGVAVMTGAQLIPAITAYGGWVQSQLPVLHGLVRRLQADLAAGDLIKAKRDWLAAHLKYETLGAAYDAFGDLDGEINPMPTRAVDPATDPSLVGFHKIEALLWSGAGAATIAPYAKKLAGAVQDLTDTFASGRTMNPIDIGLRSHEILENAVQFVLTDRDDAGSHTELATLDANLNGTRKALSVIEPLVASRLDLTDVHTWLDKSQALVESYRHRGGWTPFTSLTSSQREVLNATLSQTVEYLSQVAVVTDPRGGF